MGKLRDIINSADNSKEIADDVRENLHILMSLADSKLKQFQDEIVMDLKNGKTTDDLTVPITKSVGTYSEARAVTADSTTDVLGEVANVIDSMVSDHSAKGVIGGIAGIAHHALDTIMGTGEGTEQETRLYMVTPDYPAIVRYDFAFWARNIKAESIRKHCETALACVMYKSSVDVTKLTFNDFLTLYAPVLNAAFGDDQAELEHMITKAEDTYNRFLRASQPVKLMRDAQTDQSGIDMDQAKNIVACHAEPRGIVMSKSMKPQIGNF